MKYVNIWLTILCNTLLSLLSYMYCYVFLCSFLFVNISPRIPLPFISLIQIHSYSVWHTSPYCFSDICPMYSYFRCRNIDSVFCCHSVDYIFVLWRLSISKTKIFWKKDSNDFDTSAVDLWAQTRVVDREGKMASYTIPHYLLVTPLKEVILPEYLPCQRNCKKSSP